MKPFVILLGNEKGGSGKTTTASNLLFSIMYSGNSVSVLDLDIRQHSLLRYLQNREDFNAQNGHNFCMPKVLQLKAGLELSNDPDAIAAYFCDLVNADGSQFVIIDTPGSCTALSTVAHSFADIIITPINDSFIDLDLIGKVRGNDYKKMSPSIYSSMIWEQRIVRSKRDKGRIDWIVVRNRLSNLDSSNRREMEKALAHLSKNLAFRTAAGFSERIIYRALFPYGLTLLDIFEQKSSIQITPSHIAARAELRAFMKEIGIADLKQEESPDHQAVLELDAPA